MTSHLPGKWIATAGVVMAIGHASLAALGNETSAARVLHLVIALALLVVAGLALRRGFVPRRGRTIGASLFTAICISVLALQLTDRSLLGAPTAFFPTCLLGLFLSSKLQTAEGQPTV